jgi:hypothetical protein
MLSTLLDCFEKGGRMLLRILKCGAIKEGAECGGIFAKVEIDGKVEYVCQKCGWQVTGTSVYEPEDDEKPD